MKWIRRRMLGVLVLAAAIASASTSASSFESPSASTSTTANSHHDGKLSSARATRRLGGGNKGNDDDEFGVFAEEKVGLFLLAEHEYEDEDSQASRPQRHLSNSDIDSSKPSATYHVELEGGQIYQLVNVSPDFFVDEETGGSKASKMRSKSSKAMLTIPTGSSLTGSEINLNGMEPEMADVDEDESEGGYESEKKNIFNLRRTQQTIPLKPNYEEVSRHMANLRRRLAQGPDGIKKIAAVKLTSTSSFTPNVFYGSSTQALSNYVFVTTGDPINLKSQYKACSHGKLKIEPPATSIDFVSRSRVVG